MVAQYRYALAMIMMASLVAGVQPTAVMAESTGEPKVPRCFSSSAIPDSPEPYMLFGMRGSGETPEAGKGTGLGTRVELLYERLRREKKFATLRCAYVEPNQYAAMGVPSVLPPRISEWEKYVNEVASSGIALKQALKSYLERFPNSKIIVAGYSQGAAGVHIAVSTLVTDYPQFKSRIAGVFLIADPLADLTDPRLMPKYSIADLRSPSKIWAPPTYGILKLTNSKTGKAGNFVAQFSLEFGRKAVNITDWVVNPLGQLLKLPGKKVDKEVTDALFGVQEVMPLTGLLSTSLAQGYVVYDKVLTARAMAQQGVPVFAVCRGGDAVCSPVSSLLKNSLNLDYHSNAYFETWWVDQAVSKIR